MTREEQHVAKQDFLNEWSTFQANIPEDFLVLVLPNLPEGTKPNRIINTRYARTYDRVILTELKNITQCD